MSLRRFWHQRFGHVWGEWLFPMGDQESWLMGPRRGCDCGMVEFKPDPLLAAFKPFQSFVIEWHGMLISSNGQRIIAEDKESGIKRDLTATRVGDLDRRLFTILQNYRV